METPQRRSRQDLFGSLLFILNSARMSFKKLFFKSVSFPFNLPCFHPTEFLTHINHLSSTSLRTGRPLKDARVLSTKFSIIYPTCLMSCTSTVRCQSDVLQLQQRMISGQGLWVCHIQRCCLNEPSLKGFHQGVLIN